VRAQIQLGSVFGVKIGLHYSWFLIALLIVFSLSGDFRAKNPSWSEGLVVGLAALTALLFFASLLLHELSHSLVAKAYGLPVRGITLFALGGISEIERGAESAKTEFWIAVVGPLTSALIGLSCLSVVKLLERAASDPFIAALSWLGYINLGLALFNLIPGYPLDGGRILRAAIWWKTGDMDRSTRMAARAGQAVAATFIALGVLEFFSGAGLGGLWVAFIGWFLLQAAGESYVETGLMRSLKNVRVGDVMERDCPTVSESLNVEEFVNNELLRTGRRCYVVADREGHLSGLITPHSIKQVDRDKWPLTRVAEAMLPVDKIRTIMPETRLTDALEMMSRDDINQIPVMLDGDLMGILSRAAVLNYLQTKTELQV